MNIEQVQTFLAVVAEGSFGTAAKQLQLAQSTVSTRIQHLEQELNTLLFVRKHSGTKLTPAGRRFITHARRWVSVLEQVRWDIGLPTYYLATLRVGGTVALRPSFWANLAVLMQQTTPHVVLHGKVLPTDSLIQQVMDKQLDIGLLPYPPAIPELIEEYLPIPKPEGAVCPCYLIYLRGYEDEVLDQALHGLRKVALQPEPPVISSS